jgi:hypothetical protein
MSPFSRDRQPFDLPRMLGPFQPARASARDPACDGRNALVAGIANDQSIAWGRAK